jgi:hypothetical protein
VPINSDIMSSNLDEGEVHEKCQDFCYYMVMCKGEWRILFVCLLVLNATFNNISVISWRSVLFVEETGGPGENHRPVVSHRQTLSHNVVHLALIEIRTHKIRVDRH